MDEIKIEKSEADTSQTEQKLSKNQMKKLRKREKWLEIKRDKRKEVRSKRKKRLMELKEKGELIGRSRKSLKSNTMKNSNCKIRVALDLSLDKYMSEKDIVSLSSQIQHSYSANRRAENPMQLYCCGLSGKSLKRLEDIGDYKGWDIHIETNDFTQVFPKEDIVYLSSESPNILTTLSEDKVYVIGGLVDHNSHKGLCHSLAIQKGVKHAQLPISEYLQLKGRKVLPVNHVFSVLLRYTELHDWKQALLLEMPQRKGFCRKDEDDQNNGVCPSQTDDGNGLGNGSESGEDNVEVEIADEKSSVVVNDAIDVGGNGLSDESGKDNVEMATREEKSSVVVNDAIDVGGNGLSDESGKDNVEMATTEEKSSVVDNDAIDVGGNGLKDESGKDNVEMATREEKSSVVDNDAEDAVKVELELESKS